MKSNEDIQEAVEELQEILSDVKDKMDTFKQIVRRNAKDITYQRFKSYPYGHITMALDNDHDYVGKDMFTLEDIIREIEDQIEFEEEENEESEVV